MWLLYIIMSSCWFDTSLKIFKYLIFTYHHIVMFLVFVGPVLYTAAVDPETLADMLSNADVTSFEGHRVRLASCHEHAPVDRFCEGELQLVSVYNEKFLLGYAFSGGQYYTGSRTVR